MKIFAAAALVSLLPLSAFAERWSCDCKTVDEDGEEMIVVTEGNNKTEAMRICTDQDKWAGAIVPDSCASLGRGDR